MWISIVQQVFTHVNFYALSSLFVYIVTELSEIHSILLIRLLMFFSGRASTQI